MANSETKCEYSVCDVTDEQQVQVAIEDCVKKFGGYGCRRRKRQGKPNSGHGCIAAEVPHAADGWTEQIHHR
jgi:hypothetical protein